MPARKVTRSIHEGARDLARDIATTDAYVTSRRQRKKVEMLFAHLKRILKLDRLRLRGPNVPGTSSIWQPPPRTCARWQSSSQCRRNHYPPEPISGFRHSSAAIRRPPNADFFNTIHPKRTFGSSHNPVQPERSRRPRDDARGIGSERALRLRSVRTKVGARRMEVGKRPPSQQPVHRLHEAHQLIGLDTYESAPAARMRSSSSRPA